MAMRNEHGVTIYLVSVEEGIKTTIGGAGVTIKLQPWQGSLRVAARSLASQSHAVCDAQAAGWLTLLFLALPSFSEVFQSEPHPRPPPAGASTFKTGCSS